MAKYIFDFEQSKNKAIVISENLELLRETFSVEDKSARFRSGKNRFFSKSKSVITPTGRYNDGLTVEFIKYIKNNDELNEVIVTDKLKQRLKSSFDVKIPDMSLPLRPYQQQAIEKMLKFGRGLCIVGTGGGKTLITSTLIQSLLNYKPKCKILLVLPPQLVNQTYQEFLIHGLKKEQICRWDKDNSPSNDCNVVISSINIIQSKKQNIKWIEYVDFFLFDEVHKVKRGSVTSKIIEKIKTPHKFGFTGTLPVEDLDKWNVIGIFGSTLIEVSASELREMKYVTNAKVAFIKIDHPDAKLSVADRENPVKAYHEELEFLIKNEKRNLLISSLCKKMKNNVLILVDRIEHGEILENYIKQGTDKQVFFICGNTTKEDREQIQLKMENCNNIVCIAISSIFSTGINIKNLHYIMFMSGGKAFIRIIQSIGRGLRLHPSKNILCIIDIVDNLKYSLKHYEERLNIYEKENINYVTKSS